MLISWHLWSDQASHLADDWKVSHITWDMFGRLIFKVPWSANIWAKGIRSKSTFVENHFCVLDFDDGEMTLKNAVENYFCDYQHIIGTTRNHQKPKGDKPACDRFRVVVPWEKPISSLVKYELNMSDRIDFYYADPSCKDAARFFWPCIKIISANFDEHSEKMPVKRITKKAIESAKRIESLDKSYSENYIKKILRGKIEIGNRNQACFKIGCEGFKIGLSINDVVGMIQKSNAICDPGSFPEKELVDAVSSAYRNKST